MKHRRNRARRRDEGTAAVEAAFIAPILFLAILGIVEFGIALWQWNTMLLAVEQAGRYAMINYKTVTPALAEARRRQCRCRCQSRGTLPAGPGTG